MLFWPCPLILNWLALYLFVFLVFSLYSSYEHHAPVLSYLSCWTGNIYYTFTAGLIRKYLQCCKYSCITPYLPPISIPRTKYSTAIPNSVHTLITAMKNLQSTLTRWSHSHAPPDAVSDAYMQFGDRFNAAVYAFQGCGIDTTYVLAPSFGDQ